MYFIYSIIFLLFIGTGALLVWRGYREYLVHQVARKTSLDDLGKRKLLFFKQKMRHEHPLMLLISNSFLVVGLFLLTFLHISSTFRMNELRYETQQLKEATVSLKEEQAAILNLPIFSYPSQGVSFQAIDWEKLLVKNNREERFAAEKELAYQLSPFLGRTMLLIFIDQPMQEVTLTFTSRLAATSELPLWEENWERVIEDMAQASLITQGIFSVQFTEEPEKSFEQMVVRDDKDHWQVLDRRHLSIDLDEPDTSTEKKEVEVEEKNQSEIETETHTEKDMEQKGRVTIHE